MKCVASAWYCPGVDGWDWCLKAPGRIRVLSDRDEGYTTEHGARRAAQRAATRLGLTIVKEG